MVEVKDLRGLVDLVVKFIMVVLVEVVDTSAPPADLEIIKPAHRSHLFQLQLLYNPKDILEEIMFRILGAVEEELVALVVMQPLLGHPALEEMVE